MRLFYLSLLLILPYTQAFPQLYCSTKKGFYTFSEIQKDSAYVEIFSSYSHFLTSGFNNCNEYLHIKNEAKDSTYVGKQTQLLKIKNDYYIFFKQKEGENPIKIKLEICTNDNRFYHRNRAYASKLSFQIDLLEDSMWTTRSMVPPAHTLLDEINPYQPDTLFKKIADQKSDSIIYQIKNVHQPRIAKYRSLVDSIEFLEPDVIDSLLLISYDNYCHRMEPYYYPGKEDDILYQLSIKKPEYLIQYVEKNHSTKNYILRMIRGHHLNKTIVKNVKKVNIDSEAKREIVKQRGIRVRGDIISSTIYCTIFAAEIAVFVLLIKWIF